MDDKKPVKDYSTIIPNLKLEDIDALNQMILRIYIYII